ncbi:MAG: hypothetical protein CSB44_05185 [Gammaproteobacteria bacterium]|nr:MAG: hypothetical protein CSB44_05185 [Gammaproteobacteria bacterium]
MKKQLISAVVFLASGGMAVADDRIEDFPVPEDSHLEVVARGMVHNGFVVDIASFRNPGSLEQTLEFYAGEWGEPNDGDENTPPAYLVDEVEDRIYISWMNDGFNHVLDLDAKQTTESVGTLSIMSLEGKPMDRALDFVVDGDSLQTISESEDPGVGKSLLLLIDSTLNVEHAASAYERELLRNGWHRGSRLPHENGLLLSFNDGSNRDLSLVISPGDSGGSSIVLNELTR